VTHVLSGDFGMDPFTGYVASTTGSAPSPNAAIGR